MPVKSCGKGKYKYGDQGKCYSGPNAKAKAEKQGKAIQASKRKR
jgi:hypothetical protein